jgi:hypothetical protein
LKKQPREILIEDKTMEELLNAVECVLNVDYLHIAKEPTALSCGHCICKECIPKKGRNFVCSKCKLTNSSALDKPRVSFGINYLINANVENLTNHLKTKFESFSKSHSFLK